MPANEMLLKKRLQVQGDEWMVEVWLNDEEQPTWCAWKGFKYTAPTGDEGLRFDPQNPIYVPGKILKMVKPYMNPKHDAQTV